MRTKQSHHIWRKEEEFFLLENREKYSLIEFSNLLSRSKSSIKAKISSLKISVAKPKDRNYYLEKDIQFLKDNYDKITVVNLSKLLGKTITSVRQKLSSLGLKGIYTNIIATKEQIDFIKENYLKLSRKEISDILQFKEDKVKSLIHTHKLRKLLNYDLKNQEYVTCSVCKNLYPNTKDYFYKGKFSNCVCITCAKIKNRKSASSSPELYMKMLLNGIKSTKNRNIKCGNITDIDINYLMNLYEAQNKRCKITGILMTFSRNGGKNPSNISIDRIDNSIGYIKGNIQLVCTWANISKAYLSMEEFKEFINITYNYLNGESDEQ